MHRLRLATAAPAALIAVALLLLAPDAGAQVALDWIQGPVTAPVGADLAEVDLSEQFVYLDAENTQRLMELTENPIEGNEIATIAAVAEDESWFLLFQWDAIGYVEDSDADSLDPEQILGSIREGTEAANDERVQRGWAPMQIIGWHEPPHYDAGTNNLTWAIIGASAGEQNVNRIVKLLGRRGVMTATLVCSPDELIAASSAVDELLTGYRFRSGSTYAEFVRGSDKLAGVGLVALVAGGAGAALASSGLLARFWKVLVVGLVAVGAGLRRVFTRRTA